MMRSLYACLVWIHPRAFRRAFGDQMLCIFDEMTRHGVSASGLALDGVVSLVRQWFLRQGLWRACASIALSALLFVAALRWERAIRPWTPAVDRGGPAALMPLMKMALLSLAVITVVLIAAVGGARHVARTSRRYETLPRSHRR